MLPNARKRSWLAVGAGAAAVAIVTSLFLWPVPRTFNGTIITSGNVLEGLCPGCAPPQYSGEADPTFPNVVSIVLHRLSLNGSSVMFTVARAPGTLPVCAESGTYGGCDFVSRGGAYDIRVSNPVSAGVAYVAFSGSYGQPWL